MRLLAPGPTHYLLRTVPRGKKATAEAADEPIEDEVLEEEEAA